MFTIIGGDGKEYGPVSTEQVRVWLAGGRANLGTQAKAVGAGEWRTLGDFPEFGLPPSLTPVTGLAAPAFPTGATADFEPADRGSRLGARIIDWMLAAVAYTPGLLFMGPAFMQMVLAAQHGRSPDFTGLATGAVLLGVMMMCILTLGLLIVQVVMLGTRGQTIGKRIMGIKIVRFRDNTAAGFVHAWLLRSFVVHAIAFVLNFFLWLGTIGLIVDACFIFRADQRCLHDLIADTRVIKVRKLK